MKKNKKLRRGLIVLCAILLAFAVASAVYLQTGQYYAQDRAKSVLENSANLEIKDGLYILSPNSGEQEGEKSAMIFYPGGKVEATAYLPLMEKIANETNMTTIVVEMPFNLACFGIDKADSVMESMPQFDEFYIAGHSLGSAMASVYAEKNQQKIQGLIVMGGYVFGDYPKDRSLTIYGSLNSNLESSIDYVENICVIEGGNHANFGDYGKQKGDPNSTIPATTQEDETVEIISEFLKQAK